MKGLSACVAGLSEALVLQAVLTAVVLPPSSRGRSSCMFPAGSDFGQVY